MSSREDSTTSGTTPTRLRVERAHPETLAKKGKQQLDDVLFRKREGLSKRLRFTFQFCPTCVEYCTGLKFAQWRGTQEEEEDCPLSICTIVQFDSSEPPPIFIEEGKGKRPKWTLVHGCGPSTIEIDGTHTRIVKSSLREALGNGFYPRFEREVEETDVRKVVIKVEALESMNWLRLWKKKHFVPFWQGYLQKVMTTLALFDGKDHHKTSIDTLLEGFHNCKPAFKN